MGMGKFASMWVTDVSCLPSIAVVGGLSDPALSYKPAKLQRKHYGCVTDDIVQCPPHLKDPLSSRPIKHIGGPPKIQCGLMGQVFAYRAMYIQYISKYST